LSFHLRERRYLMRELDFSVLGVGP
jgi:hypothetical protein